MKKLKNNCPVKSFIFLLVLLLLNSCENKEPESIPMFFERCADTEYNSDLRILSVAISKAITLYPELRTFIKTEVDIQFDGDYNFLISKNLKKSIVINNNGIKSTTSFGEILNGILDQENISSKNAIIEQLSDKYPNLQVAMPVHSSEWEEDSYIPVVTFVPEEAYSSKTVDFLEGYDSNGEVVAIDAVAPPEEPIIVISENERTLNGEIIVPDPFDPPILAIPNAPYNLQGQKTGSGILLFWNAPTESLVANYNIYRKGGDDLNWTLWHTNSGMYNTTFTDLVNLNSGATYSYYITALNSEGESSPSNAINVEAPNNPRPVLSFDAIQFAVNEVELRWENDHSQYIQKTVLSRRTPGVNDYTQIAEFTPNDHDYLDHNIVPGTIYVYKINHVTPTGESNSKYDFVHAPYRDIYNSSPIIVKYIEFEDQSIEPWWMGKPEFYITITSVNPITNQSFTIKENMEFQFLERTKKYYFNRKIFDWIPGAWFDMITLSVVEFDRNLVGETTIKFEAGFNQKDSTKKGLLPFSVGIEGEYEVQNRPEDCGVDYLNYFENPVKIMAFDKGGYGVKVSVSDH